MVRVEIHDDGRITVQEFREEGLAGPLKEITPRDFYLAVTGSLEEIKPRWSVPLPAPAGFLHYARLDEGEELWVFARGAARVRYRFYDSVYEVPVPPLVTAARVSAGGRVGSVHIVVVTERDLGRLEPSTPVYAYPYAHAGWNNGMVCWGQYRVPEVRNPRQLETLPSQFLSMEANHDLAGNVAVKMDIRQLLEAVQGKDCFPEEWLVKTGTLGRWLASLGSPLDPGVLEEKSSA